MYNHPNGNPADFIEIKNVANYNVDLFSYRFDDGIDFEFAYNDEILFLPVNLPLWSMISMPFLRNMIPTISESAESLVVIFPMAAKKLTSNLIIPILFLYL